VALQLAASAHRRAAGRGRQGRATLIQSALLSLETWMYACRVFASVQNRPPRSAYRHARAAFVATRPIGSVPPRCSLMKPEVSVVCSGPRGARSVGPAQPGQPWMAGHSDPLVHRARPCAPLPSTTAPAGDSTGGRSVYPRLVLTVTSGSLRGATSTALDVPREHDCHSGCVLPLTIGVVTCEHRYNAVLVSMRHRVTGPAGQPP
jgi:hypothetical protein